MKPSRKLRLKIAEGGGGQAIFSGLKIGNFLGTLNLVLPSTRNFLVDLSDAFVRLSLTCRVAN